LILASKAAPSTNGSAEGRPDPIPRPASLPVVVEPIANRTEPRTFACTVEMHASGKLLVRVTDSHRPGYWAGVQINPPDLHWNEGNPADDVYDPG
jgi:hypothetical protein